MKDLRFKLLVFSSIPLFFYRLPRATYMIRHKEKYSAEEIDLMALKCVEEIHIRSNVSPIVTGIENIPDEDGLIFYSNHQGKYDAVGFLRSVGKKISILWSRKTAVQPLTAQIASLTDSVLIDLEDKKDAVKAIRNVTEAVRAGRNFLIYPEGKYDDNHNRLLEFKTGCFAPALKTGATIIPVCIYNSYRALNINSLGREYPEIHYLSPIYASEYEGMTKHELADLVKSRIEEKLCERRAFHGD